MTAATEPRPGPHVARHADPRPRAHHVRLLHRHRRVRGHGPPARHRPRPRRLDPARRPGRHRLRPRRRTSARRSSPSPPRGCRARASSSSASASSSSATSSRPSRPAMLFLIVARVVAAFAHGTMFGVGAVVAASVVPPNKRASAIGLMFTGLTLANILGVPFGTFVGQGLGWRATFWFITGLGVIALVPVALLVPFIKRRPHGAARPRVRRPRPRPGAPRHLDHRLRLGQRLHLLHLHRADPAGHERLHARRRSPPSC